MGSFLFAFFCFFIFLSGGRAVADRFICSRNTNFANIENEVDSISNSLVDLDARVTRALYYSYASVTFTSSTIFTTYGAQYVYKVGNMVYLHLLFNINQAVSAGGILASIPVGYRIRSTAENLGVMNITDMSISAYVINANGYITASSTMSVGRYEINTCYPLF